MSSLKISTSKFRVIPEPKGLRDAAFKAARLGAKAPAPEWVKDLIPTHHDVVSTYLEMNEDANAGYPYSVEGQKKVEWARHNHVEAVKRVQLRIAALRAVDVDVLDSMSAVELVRAGFVDPTAVIEKNEPTSIQKLEEGRPRNVICGSCVDESIDRLLFGPLNKAQIESWGDVPSCIGLGFTSEGVKQICWSMMQLCFESRGKPLASSDVSGWEFSMQRWHFRADWIRRCAASGVDEASDYAQIMWKRMICIFRSVYVFTDGTMWAQTVDGWQKSGKINTSSTNTQLEK